MSDNENEITTEQKSKSKVKNGIDLGELVAACCDLAKRSGIIIKTIFEKGDLQVIDKAYDNKKHLTSEDMLKAKDPTTVADILAQNLIMGSLKNLFPLLTVCGEEEVTEINNEDIVIPNTNYDYTVPSQYNNIDVKDLIVWVDPIDGTKEFTEGLFDAVTTLIGISYKGRPIAGIINRPFSAQLIWCIVGLGAYGYKKSIELRDHNRRIICTTRSHFQPYMKDYICACNPTGFVRAGGCGGKILMIVEGQCDAYVFPSKGTKKWDTCAPEALLMELGGQLTKPNGELYYYHIDNNRNYNNNEGFIATLFGNDYHSTFLLKNINLNNQVDLVVYGATGYTGKLCVEHLYEQYLNSNNKKKYRFAIAGRNRNKLDELVNNLNTTYNLNVNEEKSIDKIDIIVVDNNNINDLENMVKKCRVICNCVGPYSKYAEQLIQICCKYGVDYVDLSGEIHWMLDMIKKYEDEAIRSNTRIVHAAGFVSTYCDLIVHHLYKYIDEKYHINENQQDDKKFVTDIFINIRQGKNATTAMSGGTINSWLTSLQEINSVNNNNNLKKLMSSVNKSSLLPSYSPTAKSYTIPWIYGLVDYYTINRTNLLLKNKYSKNKFIVNYERLSTPNIFVSWIILILLFIFLLLLKLPIINKILLSLLKNVLPKSGEGPTREYLLTTHWDMKGITKYNNKHITFKLIGKGEPGYWCTSKCLVEEGLSFADQRKDEKLRDIHGGFLTPSIAFGHDLLKRLTDTNCFFYNIEETD